MICNARPYIGESPYITMIESPTDVTWAYPLFEMLARVGLRIWHDDDIRKNEMNYWLNCKKYDAHCSAYVVFMTQGAVCNHVFRKRFTHAIESGKPIMVIIYQQPVLSYGMAKQVEFVEKKIYVSEMNDRVVTDILSWDRVKTSIGEANHSLVVHAMENPPEEHQTDADWQIEVDHPPISVDLNNMVEKEEPDRKKPVTTQQGPDLNSDKTEETINDSVFEATIVSDDILKIDEDDPFDQTIVPQRIQKPVFISMASGEMIYGRSDRTSVGRKKLAPNVSADVAFDDACTLFSRMHFEIICVNKQSILVCKHPNGLSLNGIHDIEADEKIEITGISAIQIPSRQTLMLCEPDKAKKTVILFGAFENAKKLEEAKKIPMLESLQTGEIQVFIDHFRLGRNFQWVSGASSSLALSREHADITMANGECWLEDHSGNGTYINGNLVHEKKERLDDGMIIEVKVLHRPDVPSEKFIFHLIEVKRK